MAAFKCPACGESTWGSLKHCPRCGEPLIQNCPECGGTWRYIYKSAYQFCPSCGTRVEPASLRR